MGKLKVTFLLVKNSFSKLNDFNFFKVFIKKFIQTVLKLNKIRNKLVCTLDCQGKSYGWFNARNMFGVGLLQELIINTK